MVAQPPTDPNPLPSAKRMRKIWPISITQDRTNRTSGSVNDYLQEVTRVNLSSSTYQIREKKWQVKTIVLKTRDTTICKWILKQRLVNGKKQFLLKFSSGTVTRTQVTQSAYTVSINWFEVDATFFCQNFTYLFVCDGIAEYFKVWLWVVMQENRRNIPWDWCSMNNGMENLTCDPFSFPHALNICSVETGKKMEKRLLLLKIKMNNL